MPPRGSKRVKVKKEQESDVVEINLMEPIQSASDDSDDDLFSPVSAPAQRKSSRPSKPVITTPKDSDSEDEVIESDSSDNSKRRKNSSNKKSNGAVKNTRNQKTSKPKPKPKVMLKSKASKGKKKKSDTEDEEISEEEEEDLEENSEEDEIESKRNAKPKRSSGKGKGGGRKGKGREGKGSGESSEDDIEYDQSLLDGIDDGESSTNVWVKPNYQDKVWFKKNCLMCQVCKNSFKTTGEALECFNKHKKHIRCFACFMLIPNGQDATKRLFKHYLRRHDQGEKQGTVKCPRCEQSISFKSVSCHIIDKHFSEVLDQSEKCTTDPGKERNQKKNGKKKSGDDDEEESSEQSENEDQDEEEEEDGEETEEEEGESDG